MSDTEYTLIFWLGPKNDGTPNTDVDLAIALAAMTISFETRQVAGCNLGGAVLTLKIKPA